jgi:DNA-binding CsgD family transcriptional regulator
MTDQKIGRETSAALLVHALCNSLYIVVTGHGWIEFIWHAAIFILAAIIIILISPQMDRRWNYIFFIICGISTQLFTSAGNFMAASFFCLAALEYHGRNSMLSLAALMIISLFVKAIIFEYPVNIMASNLVVEVWFCWIFYKKAVPKQARADEIEGFTAEETKIFNLMLQGYSSKQIPDFLESDIKDSTVRKKIHNMRKKTGSATDSQMVGKVMTRIGHEKNS